MAIMSISDFNWTPVRVPHAVTAAVTRTTMVPVASECAVHRSLSGVITTYRNIAVVCVGREPRAVDSRTAWATLITEAPLGPCSRRIRRRRRHLIRRLIFSHMLSLSHTHIHTHTHKHTDTLTHIVCPSLRACFCRCGICLYTSVSLSYGFFSYNTRELIVNATTDRRRPRQHARRPSHITRRPNEL